MKSLILIATLAFTTFAGAAELYNYNCTQLNPKSEITTVSVKELAIVTDEVSFGSHYDAVARVKVDIVTKKKNKVIFEQSFFAHATTEDVFYQISAVKNEGVKFYLYLDEDDQAGVEFTLEDGSKEKISLSCK